jgi:hypothetical protein
MRSRRNTRTPKTDSSAEQNGTTAEDQGASTITLRQRKLNALKDDLNSSSTNGPNTPIKSKGNGTNASPSKAAQSTTSTLATPNASATAVTPTNSSGQSFAVLLTQGIISGDEEKIGSVIKNTSGNLISVANTVRDLPVIHVIPFLNFIEKQLRHGDLKNTREWIIWARAVLNVHTSYLSSVTDLDRKLGSLAEWMQKRVRNMDKLLCLQGKLGMIAEQMNRRAHPLLFAQQKPLVIFQPDEGDSDAEEAEYEYEGGSNDEWWQDELGMNSEQDEEEEDGSEEEDTDKEEV